MCELGAGVGLAGLAFVAAGGCNSVMITDGNAQCVESLKVALEANIGPGGVGGGVDAKLLVWSESLTGLDVPRAGTYDTVCGADCLFFEDYHGALIHTIDTLLSDSGKALLYAPLRYQSQVPKTQLQQSHIDFHPARVSLRLKPCLPQKGGGRATLPPLLAGVPHDSLLDSRHINIANRWA